VTVIQSEIPISLPTRSLTSDSEISCGIIFPDQKHSPVSLYAAFVKNGNQAGNIGL
jgi:hypothetical protein